MGAKQIQPSTNWALKEVLSKVLIPNLNEIKITRISKEKKQVAKRIKREKGNGLEVGLPKYLLLLLCICEVAFQSYFC